MRNWRAILFLFATLTGGLSQVRVELAFDRSLYVRYEPLIATVSITNQSGRELELSDGPGQPWFSFQIQSSDGRPVTTRVQSYELNPAQMGPGQTLTRQMNLTPLYAMDEFGGYRVRATVFNKQEQKFYSSSAVSFELTDGRQIWQQKVGVPPGHPDEGSTRLVTLMAHRMPQSTALYIRIEDGERGRVYCTHRIGRFVNFGTPAVQLDSKNEIHLLQLQAPRSYLYSHFGLNGEVIDRRVYNNSGTNPPKLQQGLDGAVTVVGGQFLDPNATPPEKTEATLDSRPVPLPTPPPVAAVKKTSPSPSPSPTPKRP